MVARTLMLLLSDSFPVTCLLTHCSAHICPSEMTWLLPGQSGRPLRSCSSCLSSPIPADDTLCSLIVMFKTEKTSPLCWPHVTPAWEPLGQGLAGHNLHLLSRLAWPWMKDFRYKWLIGKDLIHYFLHRRVNESLSHHLCTLLSFLLGRFCSKLIVICYNLFVK
jgi:hypothetical protein